MFFLSLFLLSVCHCIRKVHICYFLANKNLLFLNILQIINYKKKTLKFVLYCFLLGYHDLNKTFQY